MLLSSDDRVTHWSFDMRPADVLIMPPSTEHDGIFHGPAAYAAIRFDLAEVMSLFKGNRGWPILPHGSTKTSIRRTPRSACAATHRLPLIISRLAQAAGRLIRRRRRFLETSIIDAVTGTIVQSLPPDTRGLLPSATQLVRQGRRLSRSRRPSPRARFRDLRPPQRVATDPASRFYDVLGLGPITYLRHKRLCAIHSVLRDSDPATATVAQVADPARLHRAWALLSLLSFAVRGVSVGNTRWPQVPRPQGDRARISPGRLRSGSTAINRSLPRSRPA